MKITSYLKLSLVSLCLALAVSADEIQTKDGARLVGTVTGINGGKITLSTSYAGDIQIDQAAVVSMTMDEALSIRLDNGTVLAGTIATQSDGEIAINNASGSVAAPVTGVAATWAPGTEDPAITALRRQWAYEAAADITGKSGNSDNFGVAMSFTATLSGPEDTLIFYTAYNQQETDDLKSADEFKVGVDYSNRFSDNLSWYARNEGGFDNIKAIDFFDVAAFGIGFDTIQKDNQTLVLRTGLSYRYETYGDGLTDDLSSAGLDFGLFHTYEWEHAKMRNTLTFTPAFEDFGDYRATHDSHVELPLTGGDWKVRFGIFNDYRSVPPVGLKEMDTTWYTRLVLSFD